MAEVARARDMELCHGQQADRSGLSSQLYELSSQLFQPELSSQLYVTDEFERLVECEHMLLYLTGQTWTRGATSEALGDELCTALDLGVHVLLAHEMVGVGGQAARHGCEFDAFFSCVDGTTPVRLMQRRIYSESALDLT